MRGGCLLDDSEIPGLGSVLLRWWLVVLRTLFSGAVLLRLLHMVLQPSLRRLGMHGTLKCKLILTIIHLSAEPRFGHFRIMKF